jgi:Asp-tRNA(Asn)/Glu-tRNA(Gln) amidotransferase A subunit family amidase
VGEADRRGRRPGGVAHTKVYERVLAFDRYDVLLAPSSQVLPFPVKLEYPTSAGGVKLGDHLGWVRYCTLISAIGCPALSVPGGFTADGLPVGLQVVAAPRADRRVLGSGTPSSRRPVRSLSSRRGWSRGAQLPCGAAR